MARRTACVLGVLAVATTTAGCDDLQATDGSCACGEIATRSAQTNGVNLNGVNLNGVNLNGVNLNGVNLNGVNLNGTLIGAGGPGEYVTLEKIKLDGTTQEVGASWLNGSKLVVETVGGDHWSGGQLDSAKLKFEVSEGGAVTKKTIKIVDADRIASGSDIWVYDLQLKVGDGLWIPLCLDSAGEPTQAILLGDTWVPATGARAPAAAGSVTFACRDAALAKCAEWGYRPWAAVGETSLREHHQACTRLVRADFCGDGTPHTTYGTPVHVLDTIGVQNLDPVQQFVVEAEWGPDGAVCVNPANIRSGEAALGCSLPACGAPFASGGLIQSGKIVSP